MQDADSLDPGNPESWVIWIILGSVYSPALHIEIIITVHRHCHHQILLSTVFSLKEVLV